MSHHRACCCNQDPPPPDCWYIADRCSCSTTGPLQYAVSCDRVHQVPNYEDGFAFHVPVGFGTACYSIAAGAVSVTTIPVGVAHSPPFEETIQNCAACCNVPGCVPFSQGAYGSSVLVSASGFNIFTGACPLQQTATTNSQTFGNGRAFPTSFAAPVPIIGDPQYTEVSYQSSMGCCLNNIPATYWRVSIGCGGSIYGQYRITFKMFSFGSPGTDFVYTYYSNVVFGTYLPLPLPSNPNAFGIRRFLRTPCVGIQWPVGTAIPPTALDPYRATDADMPASITVS